MRRQIKGSGLTVDPVGLGAMPLSIARRPNEARAFEVIEAFVEGGGEFIDTANVYCPVDENIS